MRNHGQRVVLLILAVSVAATVASVWYHYHKGRRVLDFFGPVAAQAMARAPHVELLRLEKAGGGQPLPEADSIVAGGKFWRLVDRKDVSEAKGFSNLRHALLEDASYDWRDTGQVAAANWQYGLRFVDETADISLLLDLEGCRAALAGQDSSVSIAPIAKGLLTYVNEQFAGAGQANPAASAPR